MRPADQWAGICQEAAAMAQRIGHVVAVCSVGQGKFECFDGWTKLPNGVSAKALVGCNGQVVALSE